MLASLAVVFGRVQVESFGPEVPSTQHKSTGSSSFLTEASASDPLYIAIEYLNKHSSTDKGLGFVVKNHYKTKSNGITHVYARQTFNEVEVVNGDANVNIDKYGRIISFHSSFYDGELPKEPSSLHKIDFQQKVFQVNTKSDKDFISPAEAIVKFAEQINLDKVPRVADLEQSFASDGESFPGSTLAESVYSISNVEFAAGNKVPVTLRYIIVNEPKLSLKPVWDMVVDIADQDNWFSAQLDVSDGKIHQLVDWVRQASYRVLPIGVNDPEDGDRDLLKNPQDDTASPLGWHDQGPKHRKKGGKFDTTVGNNVYAQANPDGRNGYENNFRPNGGEELDFDFELDLEKDPSESINASITNLFYWNNIMHDVSYLYGFDEASGNFQEHNFGSEGRDNDAVIANAQDGSGYNNANFATPPDGMKGRMRMYVWTQTNPRRDGDMEPGIVIHEYTHGISTRLTGGPLNSNCLGFGEAGGMGEGWGDTFATALRMRKSYTKDMEFPMGVYSAARGIRPFPYSISMKTNPQTYAYIRKWGYSGVHAKGSVWATILYGVYWEFVEKHGFDPNWYSIKEAESGKKLGGNVQFLKDIVDGMKLQPCRPTFMAARDAIIEADEANFNGENVCLIWKAMARRGLGVDARRKGRDGFKVPEECQ